MKSDDEILKIRNIIFVFFPSRNFSNAIGKTQILLISVSIILSYMKFVY